MGSGRRLGLAQVARGTPPWWTRVGGESGSASCTRFPFFFFDLVTIINIRKKKKNHNLNRCGCCYSPKVSYCCRRSPEISNDCRFSLHHIFVEMNTFSNFTLCLNLSFSLDSKQICRSGSMVLLKFNVPSLANLLLIKLFGQLWLNEMESGLFQ